MKVAVISNCQGESFARCLSALNPGFEPKFILAKESGNCEEDLQLLTESEIIFTQRGGGQHHIPNEFSQKTVLFPSIVFNGLHPDITFARGRRKGNGLLEVIHTDMSMYNSSIALFGYRHGISIDQIISFYNPYVYGNLGYFDAWESARIDLLAEGELSGIPLGELFVKWARRGAFMYSFNHPDITVMTDVARAVLHKIGIPAVNSNVCQYLTDPLREMPIWPIYPEIGARHGVNGDLNFIYLYTNLQMNLRQYVEASYRVYDRYERDSIDLINVSLTDMQSRLKFTDPPQPSQPSRISRRNPYAGAPRTQFWKDAVAGVEPSSLDPVVNPSFLIAHGEKVATAGSCFAQHIARTLAHSGFNYYVSESAPPGMTEAQAHVENYGVFSARYGNIYTVRQLVQLFERVSGRFTPQDQAWLRTDRRWVDPFRPQIVPEGFADVKELETSRSEHFAAVRELFTQCDVFIFTLGLTEGWRSRLDGAVFPIPPGVAGGEMDPDRYEFVNFTHDEIVDDLHRAIDTLTSLNPKCKVILTVSPVPLIATYEPRHALVATTYSKSVLRVAAEEAMRFYDHVEYFPSYEIITGSFNRGAYYDVDLRTVKEEGVAHVMNVFMAHYAEGASATSQKANTARPVHKPSATFDIVCDEEAIANFGA